MSGCERSSGDRAVELLGAVAGVGCQGVVCYSSGRHFLTEADPVWWLTRFKPLGECVATVAPDGDVELVVSPGWDGPRARERAPGVVVRDGSPFEALEAWSGRTGLSGRAVALWGSGKLLGRSASRFTAAIGDATSADAVCEQVSRRRAPEDLAILEETSALAEEGFRELVATARPGAAEFEVAAAVQAKLRSLGAGDTFLLLSSSQHNLALHPPTERVLVPGDVVLVELSPSLAGAYTQICRTAVVGPPPAQVEADFDLLTASLVAGAAACCPGVAVRDVVESMNSVIAGAGLGDYCRPPHMRARGHGLGLSSSLPGDVTSESPQELVEGDVFVLHPNQYLPGSGYLLCGEPLVVTPSGGRPLTGSFANLGEIRR